ncbi:MAG: rhamnulokinase [Acidobacteria bacterium]|nr:MAG: rhamnulokinase [Acidobacteriota bacterium]
MPSPLHIAVDLGAGSGRVFLAAFDADKFLLDEVHRFRYPPYFDGQYLRWNFRSIFEEIKSGLRLAVTRASAFGRKPATLGVDSWGVDYGLIGPEGKLIADPICYRDSRTDDAMARVFEIVHRDQIFEKTGIQFQKFNTLYQMFSEGEKASKLLLIPDLINYLLTGNAVTEYTNATTTQLVNARTGDWDADLIGRLDLSPGILEHIVPAGTRLGMLLPEIAADTGLRDIHVIAPGTHDTASAVAATPLNEGSAYISSGTWSLIGIERDAPLITPEAARLNFTNEGGVYNTFRFLKNVMGLWIFESCRKEWEADGNSVDYDTLIQDASQIDGFPGFIFPDDERFLNPASMLEAISTQLSEPGQHAEREPAIITKIIFDSLAFRYASVLRSIESLTNSKIERVEMVGGGGRNRYLNQATANATGLQVRSGLMEATVVGNVLVQAIASGRFRLLSDARDYVASQIEFETFTSQTVPGFAEAQARYLAIEARFEMQSPVKLAAK